jgi:hypothetical protein
MTTKERGRIRCWLKRGSGPEDLPMVNITDFDPLPAHQDCEFFFSSVKTLPAAIQAPIKIGIEFFYKRTNVLVMTYEPASFLPPPTTILASAATTQPHFVTATNSFDVGTTADYTFTLTSSVIIATTDSFLL